jgi:hypothetical protein
MAAVRHLSVSSIRMHDLLLWLQLQPVSQHLCYGKALVLLLSKHTVLSVDFWWAARIVLATACVPMLV